ncbi:MAG: 2-hydroxyacid dehydrogenase [Sphingomonadales bacterium]
MSRPVVVLTQRWPRRVERAMAERFDLRALPAGEPHSARLAEQDVIARCEGADILCPTFSDRLPASLINRLPGSIGLIASFGVGTNHIDVAAATARGIMVSNTPEVVTTDTADLTIGLIIAASRRFSEGDGLIRDDAWGGVGLFNMLGSRVAGKTLGIVGMGRIGRAVARRARGFDMPVIYHGPRPKPDVDAEYRRDITDLLGQADIVSLHCPLTPATHHLIDGARLRAMKSTAILVNTGRGPLIDEKALVTALENGTIAAAGLDVFEFEPKVSRALSQLPNTVLLPHVGTATVEAREEMGLRVIANIEAFLQTGAPRDMVSA